MYPIFGPMKSRQELTYGPGVTKVKGPAVPVAQIEVFVLHCAFADGAPMKKEKENESRRVTSSDLMYFIAVVSKM